MNNIYRYKTAKWTISGAFAYDNYILKLVDIISEYTDEKQIESVYGCPPYFAWNGGRQILHHSMNNFKSIVDEYNNRGISVNVTANSPVVTDSDLNDQDTLDVVEYIHKKNFDKSINNGIIIANEKIFNKIQSSYPRLKKICSIVNASKYPDRTEIYYDSMMKIFDVTVLHPDDNFNQKIIDKISMKNIEVCVNEQCVRNCPVRLTHYELSHIYNKDKKKLTALKQFEKGKCISGSKVLKEGMKTCALTHKQVRMFYKKGCRNFKIQGRRDPSYTFLSELYDICNYIFDEEISGHIFKRMVVQHVNELR